MDFTAAILKLTIMYPNQIVLLMETFVQKQTCCHKLYAKKMIFFYNFEKLHFATYLQYPK